MSDADSFVFLFTRLWRRCGLAETVGLWFCRLQLCGDVCLRLGSRVCVFVLCCCVSFVSEQQQQHRRFIFYWSHGLSEELETDLEVDVTTMASLWKKVSLLLLSSTWLDWTSFFGIRTEEWAHSSLEPMTFLHARESQWKGMPCRKGVWKLCTSRWPRTRHVIHCLHREVFCAVWCAEDWWMFICCWKGLRVCTALFYTTHSPSMVWWIWYLQPLWRLLGVIDVDPGMWCIGRFCTLFRILPVQPIWLELKIHTLVRHWDLLCMSLTSSSLNSPSDEHTAGNSWIR